MFSVEDIKELIKAVDQSSIQHLEWNHEGAKLVIAKSSVVPQEQAATMPAQTSPIIKETAKQATDEKPQTEFVEILASTVGTFYASSEPGAAPFVAIGDRVEPGTVVCIVEAMKLFNEVSSAVTGEIVKVLVNDGDFVEYGQPLFVVKPQ